jgi:hypothetical protein
MNNEQQCCYPLLVLLVYDNDKDKGLSRAAMKAAGSHTARAQRFPIEAPLQYRQRGESDWHEGTTINISRSGVLFSCKDDKEPHAVLQMRITFPPELTGEAETDVVCWGPIVRAESRPLGEDQHAIAAAILGYRFEQI